MNKRETEQIYSREKSDRKIASTVWIAIQSAKKKNENSRKNNRISNGEISSVLISGVGLKQFFPRFVYSICLLNSLSQHSVWCVLHFIFGSRKIDRENNNICIIIHNRRSHGELN